MASSRLLNLDDLENPFFRKVNDAFSDLIRKEPRRYLHPSKRWEYPWALEQAGLPQGGSVLDAGCGGSIFPLYLSLLGHRVSAVDLTPPPGPPSRSVGYAAADLTCLPWKPAVFDAVFCISVIEHMTTPSMRSALRELWRVLRPGGRLLLTTDYYRDRGARLTYTGPGGPFPVDWNFFDRESLEEVILRAPGFKLDGGLSLDVDWDLTGERMVRFHGYPYTSVGLVLLRG